MLDTIALCVRCASLSRQKPDSFKMIKCFLVLGAVAQEIIRNVILNKLPDLGVNLKENHSRVEVGVYTLR